MNREIKFRVTKGDRLIGYESVVDGVWFRSYGGIDWENGIYYAADRGAFCYKARNGIVNPLTHAFSFGRGLEVIGNIFQSPQLLNK